MGLPFWFDTKQLIKLLQCPRPILSVVVTKVNGVHVGGAYGPDNLSSVVN